MPRGIKSKQKPEADKKVSETTHDKTKTGKTQTVTRMKASGDSVIKSLTKKVEQLTKALHKEKAESEHYYRATKKVEQLTEALLKAKEENEHYCRALTFVESERDALLEEKKNPVVDKCAKESEVPKNPSFTLHKNMVLVEKLTDGFMVKQFKGERLSRSIVAKGYADLEKDVAGRYVINTTDVVDSVSAPIISLLNECASGAKYKIKVVVES